MTTRRSVFELIFKGDNQSAKAAAQEVKGAVAAVTAETQAATTATAKETAETQKNAAAKRDAARAAREQADAERRLKEEARRAVGSTIPSAPAGGRYNYSYHPAYQTELDRLRGGAAPVSGPSSAPPSRPGADLDAVRAQYVPIFAAQKQYQEELEKIRKAEEIGALTKDESVAAQTRVQHGYDRTVERIRRAEDAMAGNTRTIKLQAHERRNLMYQQMDIVQSLALGMPLPQVAMQQLPQIAQIYGSAGTAARAALAGILSVKGAIAGTAAVVIAGAVAWDQYLRSVKAVEMAVAGRGQRLGLTAGMAEDMARAGADTAGISVKSSRDIASQLINTGRINPEIMGDMIGFSKDFAANIGIDANAAGAELSKAFLEPSKAAQRFRAEYGWISQADEERIRRLEAQNRLFDAQALLLEKLRESMADADISKTGLDRGMGRIGRGISNLWDDTGSFINDSSDTWAGYDGSLTMVAPGAALGKKIWDVLQFRSRKAIEDAEKAAEAEANRPLMEARMLGVQAGGYAASSSANRLQRQERELSDRIASMQAGLAADDLSADERAAIIRAIDGETQALTALTNRKERALQLDQLEFQIATERNPLRRAELLAMQAMAQAEAEGLGLDERSLAVDRARRQAVNEFLGAAVNQAVGMQEEIAAREKLLALQAAGAVSMGDGVAWLERELALRPLLVAAASAEGEEKSRLESAVRNLGRAYDALSDARKREGSQAESKESQNRIADLRLEAMLIGRTIEERTRAQIMAQAERRIEKLAIDPDGNDAARHRREAHQEAEARLQVLREQRAYDLDLQNRLSGFDAAARLAANPLQRADIEAQREYARALEETGDAEYAAARAAQVRAGAYAELRGGYAELLRDQDAAIDRLRLEVQLVGFSETARRRLLAVYDAENEARRQGYDAIPGAIEQIKAHASANADLTTALERQRDAWDKVHKAAEGMIDGPIDALLKGDVKGALASFAQEFAGLYNELAWKNPLKNRMLGTNYATLDDVGGLGGIVGRIFGGPADPMALSSNAAASPGSMAVTTPMVHLSTSNLSGLPLGLGLQPAANSPQAPMGAAALSALQSVSVGGALRPDALTGLNGPFAGALTAMIGEAQQLFGAESVKIVSAFRSVERQAELWAEALAKYGSPEQARKWVAPPGASNHNHGLAADLRYGSSTVQDWFHSNASRFGLGFRMNNEPWHIEPQNVQAARAGQSLPTAEIEHLGRTADMATGKLGIFGNRAEATASGLQQIGGTFAQMLQMFGASKGPVGSIAATLVGGLFGSLGIPGFTRGGWTGAGAVTDVAGVVHAEEYVFDAAATRRIGVANLEALRRGSMRGYQTGGYVVGGRPPVSPAQEATMAAGSAPASTVAHQIEMKVSGTGNAEVAGAVRAALEHYFDDFVRNKMPGLTRSIVSNEWDA